jgi:hypothetical protein
MRMRLARRVTALEAGTSNHTNPITLFFADGSQVTWPDGARRWRGLWKGFHAPEELSPREGADLDIVRRCVASEKPGGAQIAGHVYTPNSPPIFTNIGARFEPDRSVSATSITL